VISHILIRDFAIIEEIDVGVSDGLSVITGETGAGKSIIIEAISMALGARADTAMVRHGRDRALIRLVVDEGGLPAERRSGVELLSRDISRDGKSVCRVDDEIVTLARLKKATERLADIHGQYDHQSLLDPGGHIDVVDGFGSAGISEAKARVAEAWEKYSEAKRALDELVAEEGRSRRELDFLRFEVDEIEAARPAPGEYEGLKSELKVMQNSERIHESLSAAYMEIADDAGSVSERLSRAAGRLREVSDIPGEYGAMAESAAEMLYMADELTGLLRGKLDSLDFSEQAINKAITRIDVLDRLMSKYGGTIEAVLGYRDKAAEKLADMQDIGAAKERLERELAGATKELAALSAELSALRRAAAKELEARVGEQLRELNFADAAFTVAFSKGGADASETEKISPSDFSGNGVDELEFMISANKGQPSLPVAKFASGGEMSRIMLALKSVVGEFDGIPTMIFDEIDSGVSGVTASVVGEKLKRMSQGRQIICITHLPQIAACADHHYVIEKRSDEEDTYTTLSELDEEGRVKEIARLIGGNTVTQTTLKSAREQIKASR
jgi:DNA repair protein RecN (Recombination protein N)